MIDEIKRIGAKPHKLAEKITEVDYPDVYLGQSVLLNFDWNILGIEDYSIYWTNPQGVVFLTAPNPLKYLSVAMQLVNTEKYSWSIIASTSRKFNSVLFTKKFRELQKTKKPLITPAAALCYVLLKQKSGVNNG